MSNALTDAREAMATLLGEATGAQGFAFVPDRLVPPLVFVVPDTPYLTSGATYGTFQLGLSAVLIADAKVNQTGAETLDQLVDDAVVALVNAGIGVAEVSEPYQIDPGTGTSFLGVQITTEQSVQL